jgi:hypothetical protein
MDGGVGGIAGAAGTGPGPDADAAATGGTRTDAGTSTGTGTGPAAPAQAGTAATAETETGVPALDAGGTDRLAGVSGPQPVEASPTEYLFFFLGLLPTLIAAARIYLIAHGDRATMLELLRTLNVSALVLDTFIRFIGVIGCAVSAFLLARRLLERRASPPRSWLRRVIWDHRRATVWLLAGVFAVFLSTTYWEEFYDTEHRTTVRPIDLSRIYAWLAVLYVVRAGAISLWRWYGSHRRQAGTTAAGPDTTTEPATPASPPPGTSAHSPWRPWGVATYTLLPVTVLMTWSLLQQSDDRMWLPAKVITVDRVPTVVRNEHIPQDRHFPYLNVQHGDLYTFVGYALDDNGTSTTVLSSRGILITLDDKSIVDQESCQYEPTYDVADDTPFIDRAFNRDDKWNPSFTCEQLLDKVVGP